MKRTNADRRVLREHAAPHRGKSTSACCLSIAIALIAGCSEPAIPPPQINVADVNIPPKSGSSVIDVLMVGDTDDHFTPPGEKPISDGVRSNFINMERFFRFAASETGMGLSIHKIVGQAFKCQNLYEQVRLLRNLPGNVHVFYYSGHGNRLPEARFGAKDVPGILSASQSAETLDMPWLACGYSDAQYPFPRLADIAGEISGGENRLSVVIADSCNKFVGYEKALPPQGSAVSSAGTAFGPNRRYVGLFSNENGVKLFAGTMPNNFSFYPDDGGYFTQRFLEVFSDLPNSEKMTWQQLGSSLGRIPTHRQDQPYQIPVFYNADGFTLGRL